jgi:pimeloyl-ACP methyl ester carboxylesterase
MLRPGAVATRSRRGISAAALAVVTLAGAGSAARPAAGLSMPAAVGGDSVSPARGAGVRYRSVRIEGLDVFYREAGDPRNPTIVLLGGFPSSSHMFRDLIPVLEGQFHLIAPDYPGFGNTDLPDPATFEYSFDHLTAITEQLLVQLKVTRFGLYMQDYGAPIGYRIIGRHPDWLQWLIIQNGNAYEEGFTGAWDGLRNALWKGRTPETEAPLLGFFDLAGIRQIYLAGSPDPDRISPDAWTSDAFYLARPGARRAHLDLLYDYRKNVPLYPTWQRFLREHRPPTLIVWGKGDLFFTPAGATAYRRDLPDAELHLLDGGHFVLEDHAAEIGAFVTRFYADKVAK